MFAVKKMVAIGLSVCLFVAACDDGRYSQDELDAAVAQAVEERVSVTTAGIPNAVVETTTTTTLVEDEVLAEILASDDCGFLHFAFSGADATVEEVESGTVRYGQAVAYREAAHQTMDALGCYDKPTFDTDVDSVLTQMVHMVREESSREYPNNSTWVDRNGDAYLIELADFACMVRNTMGDENKRSAIDDAVVNIGLGMAQGPWGEPSLADLSLLSYWLGGAWDIYCPIFDWQQDPDDMTTSHRNEVDDTEIELWTELTLDVRCPGATVQTTLENGFDGTVSVSSIDPDYYLDGIEIHYADVRGDGADEAVFSAGCAGAGGGNAVSSSTHVYRSTVGGLERLGQVIDGPLARAADKELVTVSYQWAADDGHCCPSVIIETAWTLQYGIWVASTVQNLDSNADAGVVLGATEEAADLAFAAVTLLGHTELFPDWRIGEIQDWLLSTCDSIAGLNGREVIMVTIFGDDGTNGFKETIGAMLGAHSAFNDFCPNDAADAVLSEAALHIEDLGL